MLVTLLVGVVCAWKLWKSCHVLVIFEPLRSSDTAYSGLFCLLDLTTVMTDVDSLPSF